MKTRTAKTKTHSAQLYLRLPEEMRAELAAIAERQGRSLNSLLVEILSEKIRVYRVVKKTTDEDPLVMAYEAASRIEDYANAIRAAVLMKKMRNGEIEVNEETYPELAALAPGAVKIPVQIEVGEALTKEEQRLADAFKTLSQEAKLALLTLIERG